MKKTKLWMYISLGTFLVSAIIAAYMFMIKPEGSVYEAPSGNITDVVSFESSEWLYATSDGTLVKMEDEETVGATYNIIDMIKEQYNVEPGILRKFYKEQGSENLWFFTSHLDNQGTSRGYMFQAKYQGGGVVLQGYAPFDGNLDNIYLLEHQGYLYVVTSGQQVAELFKVDVTNVTAGVLQNTYIYDTSKDGQQVKLTAIRTPNGISCFKAVDDYLYILYEAGMIRVATDFEDVVYQSSSSSYKVDELDSSKYISFGIIGVSASGAALVEETNTLYVTARNAYLYKMSLSDIDTLEIGQDLQCQTVDGIHFDVIPAKDNVVWYEESTGIGYVRHDSSNLLTKINFKEEKVDFSFDLEFNIFKIIQGETEDDIFYAYKNVHETNQAEETILTYINVNSKRNESVIWLVFYIALVLALISLIVFVVLAVIVRKKKEAYALKLVKDIWKQKWIYIALLPSFVLLIMFCYYEAIASIVLSFFDYSVENPTMIWNNLDNYKQVFLASDSAEAFGNLLIFLVFDLVTAIIPPLIFAFFLTVMKSERLSNTVRTLLFVANVVPSIAGMLIWKTGIYGGNGVLNTIIEWFGGEPIAFLGQTEYAKWAILMIGFPFVGAYLIFYGGMMNISSSYYEAAELEGIGIWRRFFSIDLPLILPQLKYVFITSFIASLQNFQRTYMVTGGGFGTKTPIHIMYHNMTQGEYGQASAFATVIFIMLFGATYLNLRKQKQDMEV